MVSKSNNNIIFIVLIFFIIIVLYLNFKPCDKTNLRTENEECNTCNENFEDTQNYDRKSTIKFKKTDNVKYFDKQDSPSEIANIVEEKEVNNIEEFDYDDRKINSFENLNIYNDSNKMISYDKIETNDKVSDKYNKLIGNIDSDVTTDNLRLIQGNESKDELLNLKTDYIYNNSISDNNNTLSNNNKYQPFENNGYRSV